MASLSVFLEAPIEGAARQPEGLRRLADVAAEAVHGLAHEQALDLLEAQVLEARCVRRRASSPGRRPGSRRRRPSARRARPRGRARARCPARDGRAAPPAPRARSPRPSCGIARRGSARKCWASSGMSSRRSRSGGTRISIVFRRKSRSWRNRPAATSAGRSALVAERIRTSQRRVREEPTRSNSPVSSTRSSLPCWVGGTLAISSRKSVPPSASSKRPTRSARASVKAPLTWPKSSLSKTPSEMPPALSVTNGRDARAEAAWSARATSALAGAVLAGDQHVGVRRARRGR